VETPEVAGEPLIRVPAQPHIIQTRLTSLDALRGFDMLCILGIDRLLRSLGQASHSRFLKSLGAQMVHVPWAGLHFYDLIFPLFIFIMGVSLVYSLTRTIARQGRRAAVHRVLRRSVILFVLGIFHMGGLAGGFANAYLAGVLQRIAEAYVFAALIFCLLRSRPAVMGAICVGLLVGYWALLTFVPVPGIGHASYQRGVNLAHYLDVHYLPGRSVSDTVDFEGSLLNTLGAVANCLLGVFVGLLMQSDKLPARRKVLWLWGSGALSLALGYVWGLQFPIIKLLWTSSYVLVTCGYSAILLGCFYLIIDIWKVRKWAQPFVWVGMNPITIYLVAGMVSFPAVAQRLIGGAVVFGAYGGAVVALAALGLELWFVQFLYSRRIFLRL
jgi:predicted acyltransferase